MKKIGNIYRNKKQLPSGQVVFDEYILAYEAVIHMLVVAIKGLARSIRSIIATLECISIYHVRRTEKEEIYFWYSG